MFFVLGCVDERAYTINTMTMTPERLGIESVEQAPAVAEKQTPVDPCASSELSRRKLFSTFLSATTPDSTSEVKVEEANQTSPAEEAGAAEDSTIAELYERYRQTSLAAYARTGDTDTTTSPTCSVDPVLVAQLDYESEEAAQSSSKQRGFTRRHALRIARNVAIAVGFVPATARLALTYDRYSSLWVWGKNNPDTYPDIKDVTPPEVAATNPQHGTFVFGGFGVKDASPIAEALSESLATQGRVFGINYDNIVGIQISHLAQVVGRQIIEKGLTEVSFYGHSMGGDVSLRVAAEVLRLHPKVQLRNVTLDCTPDGFNSVRSQSKNKIGLVKKIMADLNVEDGGPGTRVLVELPNSPNTDFVSFSARPPYIDASRLFDRIRVLKDEKLNTFAASNRLVIQQMDTIISTDIRATFAELHELTKRQLFAPVVTMFRPRDGSKDRTVDVDQAEQNFRDAAAEVGLNFATHMLDGDDVHHADPRALSGIYNQGLSAMLRSQAESRRMQLEALKEERLLAYLAILSAMAKRRKQAELQNLALQAPGPR